MSFLKMKLMENPPEHQISINIKEQMPDNLTALSSSNSNNH